MSHDQTPSRPRAGRSLVGLAVAAVVAALLPLAAGIPQTQASAPAAAVAATTPVTPTFGPAIDGAPDYQGQTLCTPSVKAGASKLAALIRATYGTSSIGISRSCSSGGQSEHKEGRALDWMLNVKTASQKAKADAFLGWLLATDAYGNTAAMAKRLGVMYLGWNNKFWRGYDIARGWTDLKGCSTDPAKKKSGYDTYCHRNHIHISLSWEGAQALTSFWTGSPLAPTCTAPWTSTQPGAPVAGGDLVPVTPVRVLDTRTGAGLDSPCRLGAIRWTGDRRDVVVHVTGQGGVPATAVAAVALRVTVSRRSAPNPTVSVKSTPTGALTPVLTAISAGSASATVVVPVASDGTVRLVVDRGAVDVQADVLAWAPTTATTAVAALVTPTGLTHLVAPATVFDGSDAPLRAGESRTITVAGHGGAPASGLRGLALALSVDRTSASTTVAALSGTSTVGSLSTSTVAGRVIQLVVPTSDGRITLRNLGTSPVVVRLRLQGWMSPTATTGGASLLLRTAPVRLVDSASKLGLAGAVTNAAARVVPMAGTTAVPTGAQGVLVSVSTYGGSSKGVLTLTGRGSVPAVNVIPKKWSHQVVLVPLGTDGTLGVSTTSVGTQVRVSVLGYVA